MNTGTFIPGSIIVILGVVFVAERINTVPDWTTACGTLAIGYGALLLARTFAQ